MHLPAIRFVVGMANPIRRQGSQLLKGPTILAVSTRWIVYLNARYVANFASRIERDLLVLDDQVDLQLLDTVTNGDKLGSTPDQAVLLDGADLGLELLHVGLVV